MKKKCLQEVQKKLVVEEDASKKNEYEGILMLMESKLRRLEKWNSKIILNSNYILSASLINTPVLPETEDTFGANDLEEVIDSSEDEAEDIEVVEEEVEDEEVVEEEDDYDEDDEDEEENEVEVEGDYDEYDDDLINIL